VHDGGQLIDNRTSEPDDARLVARIAAGEEAAFVIAYDRHSSYVFGSVARFLGDREAAAEVVQDAFVTLWRRARQFDARSGSLLTWLLAIARHRAIDRLRAEGRRPARDAIRLEALVTEGGSGGSQAGAEVPHELIADSATDPGTITSRRWTQSVVRTGIAELPENERRVILLGYAQDLSQAEIAERLEWPLGTVKSRTRRAMAQLRGHLAAVTDGADSSTKP
jgi:RNA polymerase sigma-70 factor, ECF subfamily